ncbi:rho GTPase-activating protein 45-like [Hetaerina americana]|uniref:rho GTPase-activating protein 45-like n=1 Tax=Hetaerina americana TaxID=62018 RepID=UPI003A7F3F0E
MDGGPMQKSPAEGTAETCRGEVTPRRISQGVGIPCCESPSISMASISSEGSTESPIVEQEEIAALTHDVRMFKEALGRLKRVFSQENERLDSLRVSAHERLSEVLRVLRSVLDKYSPLQSQELLSAAGTLIQHVKGYNYENENPDPKEFFEFIDQLALAFSSRVSEYLMGDIDIHVPAALAVSVCNKTKSCENIASDLEEQGATMDETRHGWLSPQQLDDILLNLERGVEYALHRVKLWSKYTKDIMMYVEKRVHAELEFTKSMIELCHTIRPLLTDEDHLPLQSLYLTAMDHDVDNSRSSQVTCALLLGNQFLEPLSQRCSELERVRKHLKETWQKELKKMHEAISVLRRSRSVYIHWQREIMKDIASHVPREEEQPPYIPASMEPLEIKKHCTEVETQHKAFEAESQYRAAVAEANDHHLKLQKIKAEILHQVRELIMKCDETIKAATVSYFQLQHTLISPIPIQFQALHESSKMYEPGLKYVEFVKQLPRGNSKDAFKVPFIFEPYYEGTAGLPGRKSIGGMDVEELGQDKYKAGGEIMTKTWGGMMHGGLGSDTDSFSSSPSSKSQDTSPTASPMMPSRKLISMSSGDELDNDQDTDDIPLESSMRQSMSKAALTHAFRKLKTPSRCRECDTYVYFQGADCSECGLACHKKCLETLAIQCGHKRLPRKMTTFGVELGQHLKETSAQVPYIVCKCVNEIDERGKFVKGVYRVSGVKSRVEKLCQAFENGVDLVDLTGIHPNVIANVLKLYLRQLPEPLLTFRLYADFVRIAKEFPSNAVHGSCHPAAELKTALRKLPLHHYATLAVLMQHLKQVSEVSETNKMPASNLGIVFGPTLLRTSEGRASLNSLVDTVHQTRAVELLIIHATDIFEPVEFPVTDYKLKMEGYHISRSSSSVVSSKAKRADKEQEGCSQALSFEIDLQEETVPCIHLDKRTSSAQKQDLLAEVVLLCGTSDDELPDFLLPDNSFRTIPFPVEDMTQSAEKILKVSLRDYQGLEGFSSTVNTTSKSSEKEHRRLRKSRSEITTPGMRADSIKGSLKEDILNVEGSKPLLEHQNHPPPSCGAGKNDDIALQAVNTVVSSEEFADRHSKIQNDGRTDKMGVIDKPSSLDAHVKKESGETFMPSACEPLRKSQSMMTSTKFVSGNQSNVIRKSPPRLSNILMAELRGESPVDSDYSFESHASSSVESRSPRDYYDDEEGKMVVLSNFFDARHSLTAGEEKERLKPKNVQEVEERDKGQTAKSSSQQASKTISKYDSQEVQREATSDIIETHSEEFSDHYSGSEDSKHQGSMKSISGNGDSTYTPHKREDCDHLSMIFSEKEKFQRENQCKIAASTQVIPSQKSGEEQLSLIKSQLLNYDEKEVKVLVPPEAFMVSSSLTIVPPGHQEVRQEALAYSHEVQQTSEKKLFLQEGDKEKTLSGEMVGKSSCNSISLLSRGVTSCISSHVTTAATQKSVVQRTMNVSQKARITNQTQSVESFPAPMGNQPHESVSMITQTEKESQRN